jgi:diaphanous protein
MSICCCRFDNIRLELDDVNECFELIKNLVLDTPAEPYFLSGKGEHV